MMVGMSNSSPFSSAPRSAYLHVPFCRHRCGYCNFSLVANRDHWIDEFLNAVEREIRLTLGDPTENERPPVDTLFIGGGTPTHLSPGSLQTLLDLFTGAFRLVDGGEFSIEANPNDIDDRRVRVLADAGVNRVSLGAQSFQTDKLKFLERDHDGDQIRTAVEKLIPVTPNISLDLIFAAEDETVANWREDLREATKLPIQHVSTYGLTIEKGTSFWSRRAKGEIHECTEDASARMYELAIDTLTSAGFEHYEVSNFGKPSYRCEHNRRYWTNEPFWAFGPGAASYTDGVRRTNHGSVRTYLKRIQAGQSPVASQESLSPEDSAREQLVFGLRQLRGINIDTFQQSTGFSVEHLAGRHFSMLIDEQFLVVEAGWLRLTRRGLLVSDSIWPYLL